jgi:hypothetical protein
MSQASGILLAQVLFDTLQEITQYAWTNTDVNEVTSDLTKGLITSVWLTPIHSKRLSPPITSPPITSPPITSPPITSPPPAVPPPASSPTGLNAGAAPFQPTLTPPTTTPINAPTNTPQHGGYIPPPLPTASLPAGLNAGATTFQPSTPLQPAQQPAQQTPVFQPSTPPQPAPQHPILSIQPQPQGTQPPALPQALAKRPQPPALLQALATPVPLAKSKLVQTYTDDDQRNVPPLGVYTNTVQLDVQEWVERD